MKTYVIQDVQAEDEEANKLFIETVKSQGHKVIEIGNLCWKDTIDLKVGNTFPGLVSPFGGIELAQYGLDEGWNVYWNTSFNYRWLHALGDDFLNNDMKYGRVKDLKLDPLTKYFIKDTDGFNKFKGQLVSGYALIPTIKGFGLGDWDELGVASVKRIHDEFRNFVVDGKLVTSTLYSRDGNIEYLNWDWNKTQKDFCNKIIDKLDIGMDTYVLDIFETDDGYKVGEVNCIHCSGWYAADVKKIAEALNVK